MSLLIKYSILFQTVFLCSAILNSSYYFDEQLPLRIIQTKPDVITAIGFSSEFYPIYHMNITHVDPEKNPEKRCAVYQRKLDLQVEVDFPLEKGLQNVEYSSLILHHKRLLLLLSQEGKLFHYSINEENRVEFKASYDFSSQLSGSSKKLLFLKGNHEVVAISNEKAIGFKNLEDFSIFTTFSNYKKITTLNKVMNFEHFMVIAAGSEGVFIYDSSSDDLILEKELKTKPGVFTISDAKDVSHAENTLLVLDNLSGILFFTLPTADYEGNFIPVANGEKFIHKGLDIFYISGTHMEDQYFTYEVFYLKDQKSAVVNHQTFESLPMKHADIIGDYVFELSGETIKIFYHSLPADWAPKRYNVVNFIAENGLKNFFPIDMHNYFHFIGFTHDKILLLKVRETQPQMYCGGYGEKPLPQYSYIMDVLSKNCPAKTKTGQVPFYSICHGRQEVQVRLLESRMKKFLSFENFTLIMMVVLAVILVVSCTIGTFLYFRNRNRMSSLQQEMDGLKKKFKYQEIVEEKDMTGSGSAEIEMRSQPQVKPEP